MFALLLLLKPFLLCIRILFTFSTFSSLHQTAVRFVDGPDKAAGYAQYLAPAVGSMAVSTLPSHTHSLCMYAVWLVGEPFVQAPVMCNGLSSTYVIREVSSKNCYTSRACQC